MQPPGVIDMLAALVAEPSVSCTQPALDQSNLGVVGLLAGWLEDLGFTCEQIPIPGRPGKANLIATLGSGPGGLVLAGHTDTVPCEPHLWSQDPFRLRENGQRLYGLGSCDMKGFFPLVIEAVRTLDSRKLQKPLRIVATAEEETTMAGARLLVEEGRPKAEFAVIGEPTGMQPVYAHKGISMLRISLEGQAGHSSDPALGRNALDAMHLVLGEVLRFRQQLAAQYQDPGFAVAVPTLNLGCLHGGDNPNRICGHAELDIDIRLLPGMDYQQLCGELAARVTRVAADLGIKASLSELNLPVPPFATPPDADLVQILERHSGRRAGTVAFSTEGPFFQQLGMQTLIFGAGHIDQAHQPDEYLALDQIQPAINCLRGLIKDCGLL